MKILQGTELLLSLVGAISSVWFLFEKFYPIWRLPWWTAQKAALRISTQMTQQGYTPTLIVGIGRGGAIMGALISGCLGHRPLLVIDRKYKWMGGRRIDDMIFQLQLPPAIIERVLLVAGEAHSGNTMKLYHDHFVQLGSSSVKRAVFFVQKGCTESIEYVGRYADRNLLMPWMFSRSYVREDRSELEAKATEH